MTLPEFIPFLDLETMTLDREGLPSLFLCMDPITIFTVCKTNSHVYILPKSSFYDSTLLFYSLAHDCIAQSTCTMKL